jgi:SAM-dependent methyltransferase
MTDLWRYDFGYAWPWTWGHAMAAAVFALAALALWNAGRTRWSAVLAALAIWGLAGAIIVNGLLGFSLPVRLPTEAFLAGGAGRVLDLGAGSGRSTVMVLTARPAARVTALDIFGAEYGISGNSPDRLRANAAAAGAADRLEVRVGDMRAMPFGEGEFEAVVSVAAIDHLSRDDVGRTFAEVTRVLKPGGDFLLMVINQDGWIRTAFPFFAHHGYFGGRANPDRWRDALEAAGFTVAEMGTGPGMLYLLARPVPAPAAARSTGRSPM